MPFAQIFVDSPVGRLRLVASGSALVALYLPDVEPAPIHDANDGASDPVLAHTAAQLSEYFAGKRRSFDVPLEPAGTEFQRRVWRALVTIPFGATQSYGKLARSIGQPTASRAVGAANGQNPIAIIVPCHRVIGADGSLTGYAGGLPCKEWLLRHEGSLPEQRALQI